VQLQTHFQLYPLLAINITDFMMMPGAGKDSADPDHPDYIITLKSHHSSIELLKAAVDVNHKSWELGITLNH
jgi:hypothetical protein